MDFALTEDQELFAKTIHDWVERECPKSYANQLERKEFEYPYELWDKMTAAGLHGIGIDEEYGGQGGDVMTQTIVARELARSLAGLTWVWGIPSFAGGKSVGLYGSDEQKQRFPPRPGGRQAPVRHRSHRARRRHRRAGRDEDPGLQSGRWLEANGRRSGRRRRTSPTTCCCWPVPTPTSPRRHHGLHVVPRARRVGGDGGPQHPEARHAVRTLGSEVFLDDVFVPDDLVLGEPGRAWYMLLGTLNNERIILAAVCCGILDGVLESAVEYVQQREAFGRVIGGFQAVQHVIADIAMWQRQAELVTTRRPGSSARASRAAPRRTWPNCWLRSTRLRRPTPASSCSAAWATRPRPTCSATGATCRIYRIAPITNEMVRNTVAESLGLPRSF